MVRTVTRSSAARVVMLIALIIAAFIALAIVLILLGANEDNMIVNAIVEVARFFSTPFDAMFPQDDRKVDVLVNWGLGALVYLLVGGVIARLVR